MTEKNYNPEQKTNKNLKKAATAGKMKKTNAPEIEKKAVEEKKPEASAEEVQKTATSEKGIKEQKKEEKPAKKEIVKRNEVTVNSYNLPISTKNSMAICRFIKGKTIENAMKDLQLVLEKRKVLPMKGEIPHRRGKGIMSGGFPQNATKEFMVLLKSLTGSSNLNEIDEPIIVECIPNMASRPYGGFGAWRRKSTHVKIVAREKKNLNKK